MAFDYHTQYQKYRHYFVDLARLYQTRPQAKVYLELTLTLFTISFFSYFALRPTALTIIRLWHQIQTQQQVKDELDQKIVHLNLAQANYQKLQSDLAELDLALPSSPLPASFLRQIETFIATHGLSLAALQSGNIYLLGQPSSTDSPPSLPLSTATVSFTLTVQGNYSDIKSFLADMENLKRLHLITDLSIHQPPQSQQEGRLSLTVTGQVPFFPSPKS